MKVKWYDAVQKDIPEDTLIELIKAGKNISGKHLLAINTTYGKAYKLKDVVIVIQEESTDDETQVTIIPKDWVITIIKEIEVKT